MKNFILNYSHRHASKWLVLAIDLIITALTFFIAYSIRFGLTLDFNFTNFLTQFPIVLIFATTCFLLTGSFKGVIRHTGLKDAQNIFYAICLLFVLGACLNVLNILILGTESLHIPLSILFIHFLLNSFALIISRLIFKYAYQSLQSTSIVSTRVLIYGAGESGLLTQSAIINDTHKSVVVVGFIDDKPGKIGKQLNGANVYTRQNINEKFIAKHGINEIIISIQSITKERLTEISDELLSLPVKVKIVPPVGDWLDGTLKASQIKEIQIEDLLDRAPIRLENAKVAAELDGQVVMITGAAGSIGSEIVRQISFFKSRHLVLIDQAESALYDLEQELRSNGFENFTPIVADIRDFQRVENLFKIYHPNMVFHAAAYKHVPLMESNPCEAIKINIHATRNLADLASKFKVNKFVFVSTDKAVNPTNVMGATKRVAEMYIKCLQTESETKFITTRFGNVLGSNGSVIPLFKRQIKNGGPITVTHPEVTRYFMTIPEASQLVIEAGAMGNGGEIFIFDMGESVKIYDMAKKMIRLSGLNYPKDIDIEFVGLRPGEKLYEELLANGENTIATHHKKIMKSKFSVSNCDKLKDLIEDLCLINLLNQDNHIIVSKLKEIVPEYISKNSEYEIIDERNKEILVNLSYQKEVSNYIA